MRCRDGFIGLPVWILLKYMYIFQQSPQNIQPYFAKNKVLPPYINSVLIYRLIL